jgi:uncharacterized protein YecE (DUF72 family)
VKLYAGTSGFSFKEWKGNFYPDDLPAGDMLGYYAERLPTVEINNTFYRLPKEHVLENWAAQVPDSFKFSIKASRRITHFGRLSGVEDETEYLLRAVHNNLGDRLGVVLFQLPPNMKKDVERLKTFVDLIPAGAPAVFEFRHPSWLEDDVTEILADRNIPVCISETEENVSPEIPATADWGYLRLRRQDYGENELVDWAANLRARPWQVAYVFFKHEDAGIGPKLAARLLELSDDA